MQQRFLLLGALCSVLCITEGHRYPRHFSYAGGQAGLPNVPVQSPIVQFASAPKLNTAAVQSNVPFAAGASAVNKPGPHQTVPQQQVVIPKPHANSPSKVHRYQQQPVQSFRQAVPPAQPYFNPAAQQPFVQQQHPSIQGYRASAQHPTSHQYQQPVAPPKPAGAQVAQQQNIPRYPSVSQEQSSIHQQPLVPAHLANNQVVQQSLAPAHPATKQAAQQFNIQRYPVAPAPQFQQPLLGEQQNPSPNFESQQLDSQFPQPAVAEHQKQQVSAQPQQPELNGSEVQHAEPQLQDSAVVADPQQQLTDSHAHQLQPQVHQDEAPAEPKQQPNTFQSQQQGSYFNPLGQGPVIPQSASPQHGLGFSPFPQGSSSSFRPSQQFPLSMNQESFPQGHFYPFRATDQINDQQFGAINNVEPSAEAEQQDLPVTDQPEDIPQALEVQPLADFVGVDSSTPTLEQFDPVTQPTLGLLEEKNPGHFEISQGENVERSQGELHSTPVENPASPLLVSLLEAAPSPVPQEGSPQDTDLLTQAKLHDLGSFPLDFNLPLAEDESPTQAPFVEQPQTEAPASVPEPKTDIPVLIEPFPVAQQEPNVHQHPIPEPVHIQLTEAPPQTEIRNQPPAPIQYASSQGSSGTGFSFSYFNEPMNVNALDVHVRANAARIVSQKFHEYMMDNTGFPGSVSHQKQAKRPSTGYGLPLSPPITWEG